MSCCGSRSLGYQEFPRGVLRVRELGWLRSVYSRGEGFTVVQQKEALSVLLAEAGAEGLQSMVTLRGGFYFCHQATLFPSYLPGLPFFLPWDLESNSKSYNSLLCHSVRLLFVL